MSSNLPPGVTTGIIPGNRREDAEWEEFCDWAFDRLVNSDLPVFDCRRAVLIGIARVKAEIEEEKGSDS